MNSKSLLAGLIFLSSYAFAADVPQELIDLNIDACQKIKASPMLGNDEYRPDESHLTSFCTCSVKTYFNKLLPESEWQEMKNDPMKNVPQQSDSPEVVKLKRENSKNHMAFWVFWSNVTSHSGHRDRSF